MRDLKEIPDRSELPDVIASHNELIREFNFANKNVTLEESFNCEILEVVFPASSNVVIYHKLGIRPKYRLILRQEGNGVLTDVPSGWNQFQILMTNNGAVQVTATIMLVRG
jgi:hypothetical protein